MRRLRVSLLVLLAACVIGACGDRSMSAPTSAAGRAAPKTQLGPVPGPDAPRTPISNPLASDAAAIQQGRVLFVQYNCSGCHGGRAGGGMGPSLRDEVWIYGHEDADIFDSIAQGRGHGMPGWGTRLPEDQVWRLVSYIQTLRTPREPDAPR